MNTFIVNYRNFTPIVEGMQTCGYTVLENLWEPSDVNLQDCDGYLICMYNAIKRPQQLLKLKAQLRRHNIPLITWNRDGPWHKGEKLWRLWLMKNLPLFDIYATHTLQDSAKFAPQVMYLPNAAWTSVYHLANKTLQDLRDAGRYRFDASFYGKLDAVKYGEIRARAEFFSELELRLNKRGFHCCFKHVDQMPYPDQVDFIQRSRINFNYWAGCDDGPEKSWGLPERCYGVPACGGFLLSDAREHARDDFIPGEEWVSFESLDDCTDKVSFYLQHYDTARDIAERAHARVMREHTYVHRAASLIDVARRWRAARGIVRAPLTLPVQVKQAPAEISVGAKKAR